MAKQERRPGAPKDNTNAKKHGVSKLRTALKEAGTTRIDGRTTLGRELAASRERIEADAGGRDSVSQLKHDLIERYLRTLVLIDSIDRWLFEQPSLVNKRKKSVLPVVRERTQLVDSSLRLAQAIGLNRVKPAPPSLQEYLAHRGQERDEEGASQ